MDISIFLDNLTKDATRQVFSSSLCATLTPSELSEALAIFEQENIFHQIGEGGTIRFKYKDFDYLLIPEAQDIADTVLPAAEEEAQPAAEEEAQPAAEVNADNEAAHD